MRKQKQTSIYDTAIQVRIKREKQTFFVCCDEYETIMTLKGRFLVILNQIGFEMEKQEEPLEPKDIRFCLKKRVSNYLI